MHSSQLETTKLCVLVESLTREQLIADFDVADPVLLCNDLGLQLKVGSSPASHVLSDGGSAMSIKEAVRISQLNNFMGLVCRSQILDTVPTLVEAIKVAGLVLVSDASDAPDGPASNIASPALAGLPEGVSGVLKSNGVMRFNESIDC